MELKKNPMLFDMPPSLPTGFPLQSLFPLPPAHKLTRKVRVGDMFGGEGQDEAIRNAHVEYEYDFGDGWTHVVRFLGSHTEEVVDVRAKCLSAVGHGIAEDCGGFPGWAWLKEAYATPNPTNSERERREWYENHCLNGDREGLGGQRAHLVDLERINGDLGGNAWIELLEKDRRMRAMAGY